MAEEPDSTPIAQSSPKPPHHSDSVSLLAIAQPVFVAWEKLRVVYNLVLGLFTLFLIWPAVTGDITSDIAIILPIAEGAAIANICFFAGPLIETYVRWLGYKHEWVRCFLFGSGTLLTAALAYLTLVVLLLVD